MILRILKVRVSVSGIENAQGVQGTFEIRLRTESIRRRVASRSSSMKQMAVIVKVADIIDSGYTSDCSFCEHTETGVTRGAQYVVYTRLEHSCATIDSTYTRRVAPL